MSSNAELHLAYKVGNAELSLFPYPHFFVQNVFPSDFYAEIQANLPDPAALLPIAEVRPVKGYKERFVLGLEDQSLDTLPPDKRAFWGDMRSWLVGGAFANLVLNKFASSLDERFANAPEPPKPAPARYSHPWLKSRSSRWRPSRSPRHTSRRLR